MSIAPCPNCNGTILNASRKPVSAGGGQPDLLPGLGTLFVSAKLAVVICAECGLGN